jgi:hypothetical protein
LSAAARKIRQKIRQKIGQKFGLAKRLANSGAKAIVARRPGVAGRGAVKKRVLTPQLEQSE